MLGHLEVTFLTAAIGLIGGTGSSLSDGTVLPDPGAAVVDSGTAVQLGPNIYEVNTEDSRMAEMYEKLHDVGAFLHTRGLSQEAIRVLEELGDLALSRADYLVAADAYEDGAWVAADRAREVTNGTSNGYTIRTSRQSVRSAYALTEEAERLLQKAKEASDQANDLGG